MPVFEFDTPQGRFQVEAPDAQSAMGALGQQPQQAPAAPPVSMPDAMGRGAAQGATFGFYDELRGMGEAGGLGERDPLRLGSVVSGAIDYMRGTPEAEQEYDAGAGRSRQELEAAREQRPYSTAGGEFAGGMATGLGIGGMGGTLMRSGAPLARNIAAGALEGAAYGGLYGFGQGEGLEDRLGEAAGGAAGGAFVGAASPVLAKGGEKLINAIRQSGMDKQLVKGAPTADDLFDAGRRAYDAADNAGVTFDPAGIGDLATSGQAALQQFGAHPQLQPRAYAVLGAIQDASSSGQPLKLRDVENLRKIASNAIRGTQDASDKAATAKLMELIDAFEVNPASPYVMMGDQKAGSDAIKEARDLWRRGSKSSMLEEALVKAERQAASAGSGGNIDNAIRQQIKSILNSPKKSLGLKPEEIEALERVVKGTPGQNALRLGGKLAPTGIVSGMGTIGIPSVAGEPMLGLLLAGAGMGMKGAADRATGNNLAIADAIIRAGKRPTVDPATRSALEKALRGLIVGGGAASASGLDIPDFAGAQ